MYIRIHRFKNKIIRVNRFNEKLKKKVRNLCFCKPQNFAAFKIIYSYMDKLLFFIHREIN